MPVSVPELAEVVAAITGAAALARATLHAAVPVGGKADPGPGHVARRGDRAAHGQIPGEGQLAAIGQRESQNMGLRIVGQHRAVAEPDEVGHPVAGQGRRRR
jgi:hypothetical protein